VEYQNYHLKTTKLQEYEKNAVRENLLTLTMSASVIRKTVL